MAGTEAARSSLAGARYFPAPFRSQGAFGSSRQPRSSCTTDTQVGRAEPTGRPRGLRQAAAPGPLPRGALRRAEMGEEPQPDAGREKDLGSRSQVALAKTRTADSFYHGKVQ